MKTAGFPGREKGSAETSAVENEGMIQDEQWRRERRRSAGRLLKM